MVLARSTVIELARSASAPRKMRPKDAGELRHAKIAPAISSE